MVLLLFGLSTFLHQWTELLCFVIITDSCHFYFLGQWVVGLLGAHDRCQIRNICANEIRQISFSYCRVILTPWS